MLTVSADFSRQAQNRLRRTQASLKQSLERLASGSRINSASDDAAGRATAERMQAQVRGKSQALRNINDGVSMLRSLDDAVAQVMDDLQRMRELAVQAKQGTLTSGDRVSLAAEFDALAAEIDRIGETTEFNGVSIAGGFAKPTYLPAADDALIDKLRSSWLRQSERLIEQHLGLAGDGTGLDVQVASIDGPYNVAAYVQASFYPLAVDPSGKGFDQQLVIDSDDFAVFGDRYDRIVAHEMVHAVMNRTVNMVAIHDGSTSGVGTWFKEGMAEIVPGADDRVAGTLASGLTTQQIEDRGEELLLQNAEAWGADDVFSTAHDYSVGYVLVRYLHDRISSAGGEGIKDVMAYLAANEGSGVDQALQNVAHGGYAGGLADFATDWDANGLQFVEAMDLSNDDVGALGGFDADGGEVRDADDVIPDAYDYAEQPLEGFELTWPLVNEIGLEATETVTLNVGSDRGASVDVQLLAISSANLRLDQVDLTDDASFAVGRMDRAIEMVSEAQAEIGALLSRLEIAASAEAAAMENLAAGEGRIRDADFAVEAAAYARSRVLNEVGTALLAQANAVPSVVLTLLGG